MPSLRLNHLSIIQGHISEVKSENVRRRAKLWAGKYPTNRKPVEKQRRKVMGLKLWKHNHDRQTAEDHIIVFHPRVWHKPDPLLFEL